MAALSLAAPAPFQTHASALRALTARVRPLHRSDVVADALRVVRLLAPWHRSGDAVLRAVAAQLSPEGEAPSALYTAKTPARWASIEPTPLLLVAAAARARLRPSLLIDALPGTAARQMDSALGRAAAWLVTAVGAGRFDASPLAELGTIARSRFPHASPSTIVLSGDAVALAHAGLLAAAELAEVVTRCGPAWSGPQSEECVEAARRLAFAYSESDPLTGSPAALARTVAAGVLDYPELAALREVAIVELAASMTPAGVPAVRGGTRCWLADTWIAHSALPPHSDAAQVALQAIGDACSSGFPAWEDVRGGHRDAPQHAVVVACVLAAKRNRGAAAAACR